MQVYFTTSKQTLEERFSSIEAILRITTDLGYKVLLRSKLADKNISSSKGMDFLKIPSEEISPESFTDVYLTNQKKILSSDLVICEMSSTSTGIGYDVAQAILANKPVLVLHQKGSELSETITGNKSKRLWVKNYKETELETILNNFFKEAKKVLDSKFILIIPPEIERYLSWASNKKGIRKAEIVRSAMDQYIDHDDDYRKYLSVLES